MPEIGIDVPLAEFYDGLVFGEADEATGGRATDRLNPRTGGRGGRQIRPPCAAPIARQSGSNENRQDSPIASRESVPARSRG